MPPNPVSGHLYVELVAGLKAGEIGCKPLPSWVFCWRAEFGVNPIAGGSEWPKAGTGNAWVRGHETHALNP
jgi:hypothetical protein